MLANAYKETGFRAGGACDSVEQEALGSVRSTAYVRCDGTGLSSQHLRSGVGRPPTTAEFQDKLDPRDPIWDGGGEPEQPLVIVH